MATAEDFYEDASCSSDHINDKELFVAETPRGQVAADIDVSTQTTYELIFNAMHYRCDFLFRAALPTVDADAVHSGYFFLFIKMLVGCCSPIRAVDSFYVSHYYTENGSEFFLENQN